MKIKGGFAKRNIAGSEIVVPVGKTAAQMNSMIALNEMGAFLWECLQQDIEKEQLVERVLAEYEVDRPRAEKDIEKFLDTLKANDLLA